MLLINAVKGCYVTWDDRDESQAGSSSAFERHNFPLDALEKSSKKYADFAVLMCHCSCFLIGRICPFSFENILKIKCET